MARKTKIRVAIVDDSSFMQKLMKKLIEQDPQFEVVGIASHGHEIINHFHEWNPDVITLDIQMPVLSGLPTINYLMKHSPTRIVVVSSFTTEHAQLTLQALELGAIDVVLKPQYELNENVANFTQDLHHKLKCAAQVDPSHVGIHVSSKAIKEKKTNLTYVGDVGIVIGASTGGIVALESILPQLPEKINATIFACLHLSDFFSETVWKSLHALTFLPVKLVQNHEVIQQNMIYFLRGGHHTSLYKEANHIYSKVSQPQIEPHEHCPSIDLMMQSVAQVYGKHTLGILLTGMGDDGVEGLRAIKEQGGMTLAESEESALINGMPEAARQAGVVDRSLPLMEIPNAILDFLEYRKLFLGERKIA